MPRLRNKRIGRSGADDVLPPTAIQYKIMQAWADGDFVNDLGESLSDHELLPDALTRMALESCVGGALDPGIEGFFSLLTRARLGKSQVVLRPELITQTGCPLLLHFHGDRDDQSDQRDNDGQPDDDSGAREVNVCKTHGAFPPSLKMG